VKAEECEESVTGWSGIPERLSQFAFDTILRREIQLLEKFRGD
jgi:hypothetical protein